MGNFIVGEIFVGEIEGMLSCDECGALSYLDDVLAMDRSYVCLSQQMRCLS